MLQVIARVSVLRRVHVHTACCVAPAQNNSDANRPRRTHVSVVATACVLTVASVVLMLVQEAPLH